MALLRTGIVSAMGIYRQLLLFLRPLLWQLTIEPPQTATVLGVDVGQAPPDELQSKLNRLKAINTEYSCQDFVVAEANCVDPAVEFALAVGSFCGLSYAHHHPTSRFAFPRQAPDGNHFSHWDFHAAILCNRVSRRLHSEPRL